MIKRIIFVLVFLNLFFISSSFARFPSNSALYFRPAFDGSRYFSTLQSQGLYSGGFNAALHFNYAFEPVEVVTTTGATRVAGVVNDLAVGHALGAFGINDWINVGFDVPIAVYDTFFNFTHPDGSQCVITAACPQQTKSKLGDVMVAAKIRLLDPDRFKFGIAVEPFVMLPTGSGYYLTGYGQFSGGGKVIFDLNMRHKFYMALNLGYQTLKKVNYAPDTAHAIVDDLLHYSAAASVPIGRSFSVMAELFGVTPMQSAFKHEIQSPAEFLGGFRYDPGHLKRWVFTVGGGLGLDKGWGSPGYRALAQINYRKSKVVELDEGVRVEQQPFEEKIIIIQKIHFEFNKSNIRPISFPILDDVVGVLNQNPQISMVRIEGHTDWIGSDAYNAKLSMRRAQAVRQYLLNKGISSGRLTAEGFGESRPVADNNTTLGRAKNRRTEFVVFETPPPAVSQ